MQDGGLTLKALHSIAQRELRGGAAIRATLGLWETEHLR